MNKEVFSYEVAEQYARDILDDLASRKIHFQELAKLLNINYMTMMIWRSKQNKRPMPGLVERILQFSYGEVTLKKEPLYYVDITSNLLERHLKDPSQYAVHFSIKDLELELQEVRKQMKKLEDDLLAPDISNTKKDEIAKRLHELQNLLMTITQDLKDALTVTHADLFKKTKKN